MDFRKRALLDSVATLRLRGPTAAGGLTAPRIRGLEKAVVNIRHISDITEPDPFHARRSVSGYKAEIASSSGRSHRRLRRAR
jgi:hypothetical protein